MQAGWREKVKTEKGNSDEYNFLGRFFFFIFSFLSRTRPENELQSQKSGGSTDT